MPLGTLGKYERLDVLGHGASGIVYLAKDTLLNKQVALKEVDVQAGDMRRFLEEARVMDRLRHPNIVRVNGVDRIEGKVVIDMEYVRGQNLQSLLRTEGPMPLMRACDIMAQTLDALNYAHANQTVHRDIKPANILIGRDGLVKLVDFGLAEILSTNAYAGGAGTYAYMAPEDFAEEDRSDRQSDIWAVGVTLYEMLTGQRPFYVAKVKDPFSWKRALETQSPIPISDYLPDAPPDLQTILNRALARDKRQRYQTAGAFRDDVLHLRRGEALDPATQSFAGNPRSPYPAFDLDAPNSTRFDFDSPRSDTSGSSGSNRRAFSSNDYHLPGFSPDAANGRQDGSDGESIRNGNADDTVSDIRQAATRREQWDLLTQNPSGRLAPDESRPETRDRKRETEQNPDEPPGTVVADVNPVRKGKNERRKRTPFAGRQLAAKLVVEPEGVDFGAARKGETRQVKIQARVQNVEGPVNGRIVSTPNWVSAYPPAFDRARQVITLTAHTERTWETGNFQDAVRIESSAGVVDVPVLLRVLQPRPSFGQIAAWFLPCFAAILAPAVMIAMRGPASYEASMAPVAAVSTGLLALMLLLVGIKAEIGTGERIACGLIASIMALVIGTSVAAARHSHAPFLNAGMERAYMIGSLLGLTLLLQIINMSKWKFWAGMVLLLGAGLSFWLFQTP